MCTFIDMGQEGKIDIPMPKLIIAKEIGKPVMKSVWVPSEDIYTKYWSSHGERTQAFAPINQAIAY